MNVFELQKIMWGWSEQGGRGIAVNDAGGYSCIAFIVKLHFSGEI